MLSELIASAKAGDKNSMLHLIEKFSPIIKKYGYKLDPDDGISEITLFFIELIHQINFNKLKSQSDGAIVSYIEKCIIHFYIRSGKNMYRNNMLYWDELPEKGKARIEQIVPLQEYPLDWAFPMQILTEKEHSVIIQIYEFGFTSTEIAKHLKVSRQNVNQIKKRAEAKIRAFLKEK